MAEMIVIKVRDSFISDDCVQARFSFTDALELKNLSTGEIIFALDNQKNGYHNKYLEDIRREIFPYHNIPVHRTIKNLKIYNITNQILEYDKIYEGKLRYGRYSTDTYSEYYRVVKPSNDREKDMKRAAYIIVTAERIPELRLSFEQVENLIALNQVKVILPKTIRISRLINRNLKKEDIKEAKKLSKSMKRKSTI